MITRKILSDNSLCFPVSKKIQQCEQNTSKKTIPAIKPKNRQLEFQRKTTFLAPTTETASRDQENLSTSTRQSRPGQNRTEKNIEKKH